MPNQNTEHNGHHRTSRRGASPVMTRDWQETAREAMGALSNMNVPNVIRKNPMPALAVAGAAGFVLGITVGSRMVRMLVGSIGMYTMGEVAKRYARRALEGMDLEDEDDIDVE